MSLRLFPVFALLPLSLWAATINGIVGAPVPGTPVQGAKVVLINQTSAAHVDSATSSANGSYTFSNVANGSYSITASLSGYNPARVTQVVNTTPPTYAVNISITQNNYTGVFTGMVRYGADSTPFINASVSLTDGPIDPALNKTLLTDSTGHYRFDSVYAGTDYAISASAANYVSTLTKQAVAWNSSVVVGTLYLTQSLAQSLHGTIRRADSATKVVAGAKVVVLSVARYNTTRVDSLITDSIGNYNFTGSHALNAGTYTIKVSAPGYKSNTGAPTQDSAGIAIAYGQNLAVNLTLTPAQHGASGYVYILSSTGVPIPGRDTISLPLAGVKVVLQRRTKTSATYVSLDSTTTDSYGFYWFSGMIAATGGTGGNYQLVMSKTGYGSSNSNPYPRVVTNLTTPTGPDLTSIIDVPNQYLSNGIPITPSISDRSHGLHFSTMGDHLVLDLTASTAARTIQVFDLNGKLQQRVHVKPGESRVFVPATYAPKKGFVFLMK